MAKIEINDLYNGLTNQPPWRKQPGACVDIRNQRLDLTSGSVSRNGTSLVRYLVELPTDLDPEDVLFIPFRGDIICVYDEGLIVFDGTTGTRRILTDSTGGLPYLANITKATTRWAAFRNSVMICNTATITTLSTSPNYTVSATVDRFTDLPATATEGQYYQCRFNDGAVPAGYYYRVTISGALDWQRVAAPNQPNAVFTATTMPHQLLRNSDNTYEFSTFDYADRRSGNDESNPPPNWIGEPIRDIAFQGGRMFLLTGGIISGSSSRDKSSFWIDDIDVASDVANPIEHDISNAQVGKPIFSASLGNDLFIACERGQITFTSGQEQLTNINGSDIGIADYKTAIVPPAMTGSSFVMLDEFNTLREFGINNQGFVQEGSDLQSHALKLFHGYTLSQVFRFGGTTWIPTEENIVFVHEKVIDQGNLLQTGWTKFDFNYPDGSTNLPYFFDEQQGSMKIIVLNEDNGFALLSYLHREEQSPSTYEVSPRMDFKQSVAGTYNQTINVTRFAYVSDGNAYIRVFTSGDQPEELVPVSVTSAYVEVRGDYSDTYIVGQLFEEYMDLSRFYVGASTIKPVVSSMTVYYVNTLAFDVKIGRASLTPQWQREYQYNTKFLLHDLITSSGIKTGSGSFLVMLDGSNAYCRIEHCSAFPLTLSALSFDVRYSDTKGVR